MVAHPGEEGVPQALAQLTGAVGLYWALYGAGGERLRGALPAVLPTCAQHGNCPLLVYFGVCAGAARAAVPARDGSEIICCQGAPSRAADDVLAQALAEALACHARTAEEAEATVRELTVTYQELAIAYGMMEAISLPGTQEAMAQALLAHVSSVAAADGCCLLQVDDQQELRPLAARGVGPDEIAALQHLVADLPPESVETQVVPVGSRQLLVSGLSSGPAWPGLVALARDAARPFSSREAKLVQAAGRQAGLALRNRSLVDDLRGMFISTIQALVTAIEIKDAYTCGHSRRVAHGARATASLLGLPEADAEAAYMSGIVHDIGKIGVERTVLCKPGALTDDEWQEVRSHPEHGAGIINCIPQLQHLVGGVRHHHERADGRGYPEGLGEEDIPLASRIIAVCDSYDAMTSQRSYRPALPAQQAIQELRTCVGSQFSRAVVEAFIETLCSDVQAMPA